MHSSFALAVGLCACLLHVSHEQAPAPPKPKLAETFLAEIEDEIHEGGNPAEFGNGHIARDTTAMRAYEESTIDNEQGPKRVMIRLDLYDKGEQYSVTGEVDHLNCDEEKINKSMPAFWGFLGNATFSGNKTIKHRNIEIWTFETGAGVTIELGVDAENSRDIPQMLIMKRPPNYERTITFHNFMPRTPPPSDFDIPKACSGRSHY